MFVNNEIIDELYDGAGEIRNEKAEKLYNDSKVKITKVVYENKNNFEIYSNVLDDKNKYDAHINVRSGEIENLECTCPDNNKNYCTCAHLLATMQEFVNNEEYENIYGGTAKLEKKSNTTKNTEYRSFKQVLNAFYNAEIEVEDKNEDIVKGNHKVKIYPRIIIDKLYKEVKIEISIGEEKIYKIKSLSEFYDRFLNREKGKYGSKLEFVHVKENFDNDSRPLLDFILKHAEIIKYVNSSGNAGYRYYGKVLSDNCIILSNTAMDEFFNMMNGKNLEIINDNEEMEVEYVLEQPNIKFSIEQINKDEFILEPLLDSFDYTILEGKKYLYILMEKKLYRTEKEYKDTVLKLLDIFKKNYTRGIKFSIKELPDFFSLIVPKLKNSIIIEDIDNKIREKYIPKELNVKLYLDYDKNNYLIAEIKFIYGDVEFNPLDINNVPNVARNIVQETNVLNMFRRTGFLLDTANLRFILVKDDAIYDFLVNQIEDYMQRFEVLVTDNFKAKEIREPKLGTIGVKVENNLLDIDLTGLDLDRSELKELLDKYNIRKKYHRLKDGSFIDLEKSEDIKFLSSLELGMEVGYKELESGKIKVPMYRTLYLNKLLENVAGIEVQKNSDYKELVNDLTDKEVDKDIKIPEGLKCKLRYYQKTGYKWLKTLEQYKLGGILADDMGLGKTVQILALLLDYKENEKHPLPSIVITPSSLALNWKSEIEKFTDGMKILVMGGSLEERKKKIDSINNYDLVITSYDLLKRDIEYYKEKNYIFKYQIADEAQYIKNSNTQNAKALKNINAQVKFALTGTPIENSLAELWSIFDYIMPGYLFTYKKFKQIYEVPIIKENSQEMIDKLKMLIEPFILRRVKKDVLKELPEKSVTILNSEMEGEQLKIYMSYLAQARSEAMQEIKNKGIEKSQIKILALLTRLRQICCHPALFIENYNGESSKLNQCIDIVKDAVKGGHKILIFSGYTSMFNIIEGNLSKEGIPYYKLTGQTKIDERMELVEDFNNNENVKVFLISLKAGGTGLNLIGADMVIHYDPWWNMSAENQATDRAYRIGQKNNVQVYKLITKNSIEEKIYNLQEKKSKLIDNMLNTETTFINKLSKEDIMNLFN